MNATEKPKPRQKGSKRKATASHQNGLGASAGSSYRRRPAWWEAYTGVTILNADGWTRDGTPYDKPLTRNEFIGRACDSRACWPRDFLNKIIAEAQRIA